MDLLFCHDCESNFEVVELEFVRMGLFSSGGYYGSEDWVYDD